VTDTLGNLHAIAVHAADEADCEGGKRALRRIAARREAGEYPRLVLILADHAFGNGGFPDWVEERLGCEVDIATKDPAQHRFIPLPLRWVVEQAISILGRPRRLSKDYEYDNGSSEAWLYLASIGRSLRILTRNESH
jgi:putative transposase